MRVLVINCGSTTLKYKLFQDRGAEVEQLAAAVVETTGGYRAAVEQALAALPAPADVIAHRVVHGGGRLPDVVRIDAEVLRILREVTPLAPMHNGPALEGIEATIGSGSSAGRGAGHGVSRHAPAPRLAVRPPRDPRHAAVRIPRLVPPVRHRAVRRAHRLVRAHDHHAPSRRRLLRRRHLRGRSVDTSMGYSPLEGLVMGTRAGDLDPGILTHLLHEGSRCRSSSSCCSTRPGSRAGGDGGRAGAAGAQGLRSRARSSSTCTASRNTWGPTSPLSKGRRPSCSPVGIGEHAPEIRRRVCQRFGWAGLTLDVERNRRNELRISAEGSRLAAYAIPTDEEYLIARETFRLMAPRESP